MLYLRTSSRGLIYVIRKMEGILSMFCEHSFTFYVVWDIQYSVLHLARVQMDYHAELENQM
jgi:hypothetical protein